MQDETMNIYKKARRRAGFTQESAAPYLGVSVESLKAYETGQRVPPSDVVLLMTSTYRDTLLGYQHLGITNPLAQQLFPTVEERSLIEAAVRIRNRVNRLDKDGQLDRLMEIAEDGIIDAKERPDFDKILKELYEIVQHSAELRSTYEGSL